MNRNFKGFRAMAHLLEQLGDERFAALINSDNTGKVKEFCDTLVEDRLPVEMTIEGRTYVILGFLREGETSVRGDELVNRANAMSANIGEEDGKHILKHQDQIPASLRGKVAFVFTDLRRPGDSDRVGYFVWDDDRWIQIWYGLGNHWDGSDRVLRRK